MKAALRTRYGPPEVVRVADVDNPVPGENALLVRVHATTVNRTDCAARAADPFIWRFLLGLARPRVTILGCEFAGVVEAVGARVASFNIGDRVFGYSEPTFGAHAEYLSIPETGTLATMPDGLTFEEAAPTMEGAHYALAMIRAANVRDGDHVLVNGASGAIGSAAVQLLVSLGAGVTAVCGPKNLELIQGLGVERVIDFTTEDFTRDERQYDVVIDAAGKSSFGRCRQLLRPHGTYLSSDVGPRWQNPLLALTTPLLGGKKVLFPIPRHDAAMARYLKGLIETGRFRPLIDRRYSLDVIVEAYRYVETGQKTGNVVVGVIDPRESSARG
jgi:NADPH:quinone reductase-like Zn-dependent oxidoreductase